MVGELRKPEKETREVGPQLVGVNRQERLRILFLNQAAKLPDI